MKAVILAAGQGTRIRSVCGKRPKCLITAGDQTILDHQLEALSLAGVNEVAIFVGYEKDQIINHVSARARRSIKDCTLSRTTLLPPRITFVRSGLHSSGSVVIVLSFSMLTPFSSPEFFAWLSDPTRPSR
jgi:NDP-sugar pyrophosphorylase family protein